MSMAETATLEAEMPSLTEYMERLAATADMDDDGTDDHSATIVALHKQADEEDKEAVMAVVRDRERRARLEAMHAMIARAEKRAQAAIDSVYRVRALDESAAARAQTTKVANQQRREKQLRPPYDGGKGGLDEHKQAGDDDTGTVRTHMHSRSRSRSRSGDSQRYYVRTTARDTRAELSSTLPLPRRRHTATAGLYPNTLVEIGGVEYDLLGSRRWEDDVATAAGATSGDSGSGGGKEEASPSQPQPQAQRKGEAAWLNRFRPPSTPAARFDSQVLYPRTSGLVGSFSLSSTQSPRPSSTWHHGVGLRRASETSGTGTGAGAHYANGGEPAVTSIPYVPLKAYGQDTAVTSVGQVAYSPRGVAKTEHESESVGETMTRIHVEAIRHAQAQAVAQAVRDSTAAAARGSDTSARQHAVARSGRRRGPVHAQTHAHTSTGSAYLDTGSTVSGTANPIAPATTAATTAKAQVGGVARTGETRVVARGGMGGPATVVAADQQPDRISTDTPVKGWEADMQTHAKRMRTLRTRHQLETLQQRAMC